MRTDIHWLDGPWLGALGLAARPRGGDWLDDEMADWRRAGVDVVLSLLTADEERDLDLEAPSAVAQGMTFLSLPIEDRQVPASEHELSKVLERLDSELSSGRRVVAHCRQGIGRTGLVAACLLVSRDGRRPPRLRR